MVTSPSPVIVVGAGLCGLATGLGVALRGGSAIILESSDMVGGASAYSGGMVWVGANHVAAREGIHDDLELAEAYVRDIAHDFPELLDEPAMHRWLATSPAAIEYFETAGAVDWEIIPGLADYHGEAAGALPLGRYLTGAAVEGAVLGAWRDRLRVSPNLPVGKTYAEMNEKGRRSFLVENDSLGDRLTFGTGLVAAFLARVLREPSIEIRLSTPVTELIVDESGGVVGARAEGPDGEVELHGPVVLATSSYDWNPELVQEFLGLSCEDFSSLAPQSIRGDGILLARSAGADIALIPASKVPIVPGWPSHSATGVSNGPEYAMPHCMIVDATGRRFCDDSYWVDIVGNALDKDEPHMPFFLIWDEQHHRKYGLGLTPPGGDYPAEFVTTAASLEELGSLLGVDGDRLAAQAVRFNEFAVDGRDPEFGRGTIDFVQRFCGDPAHEPNPVLGPIAEPPYFGTRLKFVGTGIGSSGVHIDGDGRVLRPSGEILTGLYAVGSVAALTTMGSGYNSGFALGRGLTLAYLVSGGLVSGGLVSGELAGR